MPAEGPLSLSAYFSGRLGERAETRVAGLKVRKGRIAAEVYSREPAPTR